MFIDSTTSGAASTTQAILERAGFKIRGRRATCPYCQGNRSLTVAIADDGLWYCHRCQRGGSVRSLARKQGISFPPPRLRKADIPKMQFRAWLSEKINQVSAEEYELTRRWRIAVAVLRCFPENEEAWQVLARFYDRQRYFELFWESSSDKLGRYWLYRLWRKHTND